MTSRPGAEPPHDPASPVTGAVAAGVAAEAAHAFLGADAELTPLGHGDSAAFRAESGGAAHLLRVHVTRRAAADPAYFTPEAIESECAWLAALGAEPDLVVQTPVRGPDGHFVVCIPRAGHAVPCTLLAWIEGAHAEGPRTPEQAADLGELLARLHVHAAHWTPPPGFTRPVYDRASWYAGLARAADLVPLGIATDEDRDLLARAIARADEELSPFARDPARTGLIHGDLHAGNYVLHAGRPCPLDFGRAGYGPWLLDLAECLQQLGPARRHDAVEAYARTRPFTDADVRRVEGYFVAALVEVYGNNASDAAEHDYLRRAIPAWRPHVERYVAGQTFLFEL